jgi:hypothetical protein
MDIANRFADGKDAGNNKRTRHLKTIGETCTITKGEDPTTMIATVLIVK